MTPRSLATIGLLAFVGALLGTVAVRDALAKDVCDGLVWRFEEDAVDPSVQFCHYATSQGLVRRSDDDSECATECERLHFARLPAIGNSRRLQVDGDNSQPTFGIVQTNAPSEDWTSIAISSDGSKLVAAAVAAVGSGGGIYTSSDAGGSWSQTSAPITLNWWSVASSSDGSKLVAAAGSGDIYTTLDAGGSWIRATGKKIKGLSQVAISSDGSQIVARAFGGGIYLQFESCAVRTRQRAVMMGAAA